MKCAIPCGGCWLHCTQEELATRATIRKVRAFAEYGGDFDTVALCDAAIAGVAGDTIKIGANTYTRETARAAVMFKVHRVDG